MNRTPMPSALEFLAHAGLLAGIATFFAVLRRRQHDPNPPEGSEEARLQVVEVVDRRIHPLPYLGRDRRREGAAQAEAWRRSA